jgi:hypothetical protein
MPESAGPGLDQTPAGGRPVPVLPAGVSPPSSPDRVRLYRDSWSNAVDVWIDSPVMGRHNQQTAIHVPDPSPVARCLTLHVQISDSHLVSVTRGKLDISSRRMVFEQVGVLYVEDVEKDSDADALVIAALLNLDEEQERAPW